MKQLLIIFFILFSLCTQAQKSCTVTNHTFQSNEELGFKIFYSWGAIWMAAGEASFSAYRVNMNNTPAYHFIGKGATYSKYDWFYKVNDVYESYADTLTLNPLRFKREAHEGGNYTSDD